MDKRILSTLFAALVLAGCASKSSEIEASYVSPVAYQSYDCAQLGEEARVISDRARLAAKRQDDNRKDDIVKTTVGMVLFWPVILANSGDGQDAAKLAQLKGQMDAIEQASRDKGCNISFAQ